MTRVAECGCGKRFDVPERLTGGFANCPSCGQAVEVAGLRDPEWRMIQAVAALAWLVIAGASFALFGAGVAVIAALVVGLGLYGFSRLL